MKDEKSSREPSGPAEVKETAGKEKAPHSPGETAERKGDVRGAGGEKGWGRVLITSVIAFVSGLALAYCGTEFQKPDVEVDGVLPVVVHGTRPGPPTGEDGEPTLWPTHELVFIFKLHNKGLSAARVGVVRVAGCASLPSNIAGEIFGSSPISAGFSGGGHRV